MSFDGGTPVEGPDFLVDYQTDSTKPSVALKTGSLSWNVRSDDGGNPGAIGTITLDPGETDVFAVSVRNGAGAGATNIVAIKLVDSTAGGPTWDHNAQGVAPGHHSRDMRGADTHVCDDEPDYTDFLEMLWSQAWDLEFQCGVSGAFFDEQLSPDQYHITVGESGSLRMLAEGTWLEVARIAFPTAIEPTQQDYEAMPPGLGLVSYDRYVVAGTITSDTFSSPAYALVLTATFQNPDLPTVVNGFMPIGIAPDVESAVELAYEYWAELRVDEPQPQSHFIPVPDAYRSTLGNDDPCSCDCQTDLCYSGVRLRFKACVKSCTSTHMGGFGAAALGCLATGPFAWACAGIAGAIAVGSDVYCLSSCKDTRMAENIDCLIANAQCENDQPEIDQQSDDAQEEGDENQ